MAEQKTADERVKTVEALAAREKREYEARVADLAGAVDRLNADLAGMHDRAAALQKSLDSASARECKEQNKRLVRDIERGAAVAAKCAQDLAGKEQALITCVRMYEDVKSVYDPAD